MIHIHFKLFNIQIVIVTGDYAIVARLSGIEPSANKEMRSPPFRITLRRFRKNFGQILADGRTLFTYSNEVMC